MPDRPQGDAVQPDGAGGEASAAETMPTLSGASGGQDWPDDADASPPQIDGFRIEGLLSDRGGQGIVWRAVQAGTNRPVALKLLRSGFFSSRGARLRFEREVELTASLEHPNIARVYETGVHQGAHYYAMELVEGEDLRRFVRERNLTRREVLELMGTVCRAVQYAHQRGIIHRDLKPANILVSGGQDGEAGRPHVMDFGLAKAVQAPPGDLAISREGSIAGSYPYMSPEQARGEGDPLDTRTDVYSLGVVLYELLTGRLPREMTGTALDVLRRIAEEDIIPPRQARKDIDRELEALLLKALTRERDGRYASAGELAADLDHYLRGEPLSARLPTPVYILRRWVWKYRGPVAAGVLVLLALVAGVAFYIHRIRTKEAEVAAARIQALHQRDAAEYAADQAREQRTLALQTLNRLVFEVQRKLAGGFGQTALRKELIDLAVEGLGQIAETTEDSFLRIDRTTAAALLQIARTCELAGRPADARRAFTRALEGFQRVAERNGYGLEARRDLCVARIALGQACLRMDDRPAARIHLEAAAEMVRGLLADYPGDSGLTEDLWAMHVGLGDLALASGEAGVARDHFAQAVALADAGNEAAEAPADAPHNAALSHRRLGDAQLALGAVSEAEKSYRTALDIARRRVEADGQDLGARCDLADSLAKVGEAALRAGRPAEARESYSQALPLFEALVQADPDRVGTAVDLAACRFMLGRAHQAEGRSDEATASYRLALETLGRLEEQGRLAGVPRYARLLEHVRRALGTQPTSVPAREGRTGNDE